MASSTDGPNEDEADTLTGTPRRSLPRFTDPALQRTHVSATKMSPSTSEPRAVAVGESLPRELATERYRTRRMLGEGGMGEVRLIEDRVVGRDLAMKVIHQSQGASAELEERFLREARVQGQLEHPSIVPVYDIGTLPNGELYFTMKRISGETLEQAIARVREARARGEAEPVARRKLLSAFAQACHAVAFAHARSVVHRDLKPANVMLGEFGEVYVLDWGIAKIEGAADSPLGALSGDHAGTQAGSLLGTPGYMAPEQARGHANAVTSAADVYALGLVLYEILALAPFHRGRTTPELVVSALKNAPARPRDVDPAVAPELDAICTRATALDPADRYASVRELREDVEAYLDGERDLERRGELAEEHLRRAKALAHENPSESARRDALRALGAAIALAPDHPGAQRFLYQLLTDSPDELPEEGEAELKAIGLADRRKASLRAAFSFVFVIGMLPILLWMGLRVAWPVAAFFGVVGFEIAYLIWMWKTGNVAPKYARIAMAGAFTAVLLMSGAFGSLVLVPQAIVAVGASLAVTLRANKLTSLWISAMMFIVPLLPLALAYAGVLPHQYELTGDTIVIHPLTVHFPKVPTLVMLVLGSAFNSILVARLLGDSLKALIGSERRSFAAEYRLRALLPPMPKS